MKSNALPEEFMMPSPARSIPSRKSKKDRQEETVQKPATKERDVLDEFMGVQV